MECVLPLFGSSKSDVDKMEAKRDVQGLIKALAYMKDNGSVSWWAAEALRRIGDEHSARCRCGAIVLKEPVMPSDCNKPSH